jgi:hypothetical protein
MAKVNKKSEKQPEEVSKQEEVSSFLAVGFDPDNNEVKLLKAYSDGRHEVLQTKHEEDYQSLVVEFKVIAATEVLVRK